MKRLLVLFFGLWISAAHAQDAALDALQTADDARGWEAVGRLELDGKGFCTAALISDRQIVTAAHCLFDRQTGAPIDLSRIEFLAGLRNGRALAYREIRRVVVHPDYVYLDDAPVASVAYDMALLELSQPIRNTSIEPFRTATQMPIGAQVGVVSYALDRAEAPSLQEVCAVLGRQSGVVVMSCDIDFGSSGAPVFLISNGIAQIVSIITSKANIGGRKVSLGAEISAPLDQLRSEMDAGRGVFRDTPPHGIRVLEPGQTNDTGALFMTPPPRQ
ncbi:serine protease [Aestuariibius sp. HNIBRBA575]|uniref:trypsin-like serine peptidase n=1 Tax=Aestuariibius sp. HNIBRBA575 TaxID=3233343 RepID=UPI0034A1B1F1